MLFATDRRKEYDSQALMMMLRNCRLVMIMLAFKAPCVRKANVDPCPATSEYLHSRMTYEAIVLKRMTKPTSETAYANVANECGGCQQELEVWAECPRSTSEDA